MGITLNKGNSHEFHHEVHVFLCTGNILNRIFNTRRLEIIFNINHSNTIDIQTAQGLRSSLTWGPPIWEIRDSTSLPGFSGQTNTTRSRYTCNRSLVMNIALSLLVFVLALSAISESSLCYIGAVTRIHVLVKIELNIELNRPRFCHGCYNALLGS